MNNPTTCGKIRPQNVSRPWKIEYKNNDGHVFTFPASFVSKGAAVKRAAADWLKDAIPDSGMTLSATEKGDLYDVYTDGFATYTIFHRDSVYYR